MKARRMMPITSLYILLRLLLFIKLLNGTDIIAQKMLLTRMVQEYKEMCPDIQTCNTTVNSEPVESTIKPIVRSLPTMASCCSQCSCKTGCGSHCCPDMHEVQRFEFQEPVQSRKECVYAQYRPFGPLSMNGYSLEMVIKCNSNISVSLEIEVGCEMDLFDVDLQGLHNGRDILPVTSNKTQVTYKNRMCAVCNGEAEPDLLYWEPQFVCERVLHPPETFADLLHVSMNNKQCNIIFLPESHGLPITRCNRLLDTCNITGDWDIYDSFTETACSLYESVYDRIYKNVHCFLCNHAQGTPMGSLCQIIPGGIRGHGFAALLDFNMLGKSDTPTVHQRTCPDGEFYDQFMDSCKAILCNAGLIYKHEKCVPFLQRLTGNAMITFSTTLALMPRYTQTIDLASIDRVVELLGNVLDSIEFSLKMRVCNVSGLIRLKTKVQEFVDNIHAQPTNRSAVYGDIDYVGIGIKVDGTYISNVTERIEEISRFFKNVSIDGFMITNRNISENVFSDALNNNRNTSLHLDTVIQLGVLGIHGWLTESLVGGYDVDDIGILPLYHLTKSDIKCITSFVVTAEPFCPKLVLRAKDFETSYVNNYLYLSDFNDNISINAAYFSEDGDYLTVCLDSYIHLTEGHIPAAAKSPEDTALVILTISCTTLSLLSLVVTLVVYCMFPRLRTVPGMNNIGLILSLVLFLSLSLVNACVDSMPKVICRAVGISLHYTLLSSFSWMFICTLHMARVFASVVERPKQGNSFKVFRHYVLFAQFVSGIVVSSTVLICYLTSDGNSIGYSDSPCYVESTIQVYSVAIPVGLVITLNLSMFTYVIITITRLDDINKNTSHERHNLIIFAKLSTLTGLMWIFGFIYQFTKSEVFAFIFTILNASQGVFIMWAFVLNKRVYDLICSRKDTFTTSPRSQTKDNTYTCSSTKFNEVRL